MEKPVLLDVELELDSFRFSTCLEDAYVGSVGHSLVLDKRLLQFVVEFEVAGGEDLEDGVAVVLEVEQVVVGFILSLDICEALCSEEALIQSICLEPLDQHSLSESQVRVVLLF